MSDELNPWEERARDEQLSAFEAELRKRINAHWESCLQWYQNEVDKSCTTLLDQINRANVITIDHINETIATAFERQASSESALIEMARALVCGGRVDPQDIWSRAQAILEARPK